MLYGFRAGCYVSGWQVDNTIYQTVTKKRWSRKPEAVFIADYLIERGESLDFTISETIEIEIEAWKLTYRIEDSVRETRKADELTVFQKLFRFQPHEGWYWQSIDRYPVYLSYHEDTWWALEVQSVAEVGHRRSQLTPGVYEVLIPMPDVKAPQEDDEPEAP